MSDIECPYCDAEQEICHDDGYGYEEGRLFEQECSECERTYTFTTSISFYYDAYKADCLNGSDHVFGMPQKLWLDERKNKELWRRRCKDCDHVQQGYDPEWRIKKDTQNDRH